MLFHFFWVFLRQSCKETGKLANGTCGKGHLLILNLANFNMKTLECSPFIFWATPMANNILLSNTFEHSFYLLNLASTWKKKRGCEMLKTLISTDNLLFLNHSRERIWCFKELVNQTCQTCRGQELLFKGTDFNWKSSPYLIRLVVISFNYNDWFFSFSHISTPITFKNSKLSAVFLCSIEELQIYLSFCMMF